MRSVTVKVQHLHKPEQKHRTMTIATFPDTISLVLCNKGASVLKLFKTLAARVLPSLKIPGLRPRIIILDKTLLFVF